MLSNKLNGEFCHFAVSEAGIREGGERWRWRHQYQQHPLHWLQHLCGEEEELQVWLFMRKEEETIESPCRKVGTSASKLSRPSRHWKDPTTTITTTPTTPTLSAMLSAPNSAACWSSICWQFSENSSARITAFWPSRFSINLLVCHLLFYLLGIVIYYQIQA